MTSHEKAAVLAAPEQESLLSRSMLTWANTFPDKPVAAIQYETPAPAQSEEMGMALSPVQGPYITRRYTLGGYQAEYPFRMICRVKPGDNSDARLEADELLSRFGQWAAGSPPSLGEGIRALRVEPTTRVSKLAVYEDGCEDYQILLRLTYEVGM